jgi:Tfp pilus assembly protein PilZ
MPEKRDIRRGLKRLDVMFGPDKPINTGFTIDISNTGVFIKSTKVYQIGTLLFVEITTPEKHIVAFEGIVMWSKAVPQQFAYTVKKAGMGVKITKFLQGKQEYHKLVSLSHH